MTAEREAIIQDKIQGDRHKSLHKVQSQKEKIKWQLEK